MTNTIEINGILRREVTCHTISNKTTTTPPPPLPPYWQMQQMHRPPLPPSSLLFTLVALAYMHVTSGQVPCPALGGVECNGGACIGGTCKCAAGIVGMPSFSIRYCIYLNHHHRPRL